MRIKCQGGIYLGIEILEEFLKFLIEKNFKKFYDSENFWKFRNKIKNLNQTSKRS